MDRSSLIKNHQTIFEFDLRQLQESIPHSSLFSFLCREIAERQIQPLSAQRIRAVEPAWDNVIAVADADITGKSTTESYELDNNLSLTL